MFISTMPHKQHHNELKTEFCTLLYEHVKRFCGWPVSRLHDKSTIPCGGITVRTGECMGGVISGVLYFFSFSKHDIIFFSYHSCRLSTFYFFLTTNDCSRDFKLGVRFYRHTLYTCNRHATVSHTQYKFCFLHYSGSVRSYIRGGG
jgi:hypothetical protein